MLLFQVFKEHKVILVLKEIRAMLVHKVIKAIEEILVLLVLKVKREILARVLKATIAHLDNIQVGYIIKIKI